MALRRRLTVTPPLHQLVRIIAHHKVDEQAYDLRQLRLDAVVASMGYAQSSASKQPATTW